MSARRKYASTRRLHVVNVRFMSMHDRVDLSKCWIVNPLHNAAQQRHNVETASKRVWLNPPGWSARVAIYHVRVWTIVHVFFLLKALRL